MIARMQASAATNSQGLCNEVPSAHPDATWTKRGTLELQRNQTTSPPRVSRIAALATQDYTREVLLVKKSVPLILLIIFAMISVAALSGLARNVAQKRTLFSDPLCKVVWKRQKPYQSAQNLAEVKKLKTVKH